MARPRTTTPRHLQHARLGKHKAPRAVAGYKRSSVALLLLRLPGRDTQARSGTGLAKTIRWVLYGGEAFREAKNNNAQPAMADSTERRAQHPAASREAANQRRFAEAVLIFKESDMEAKHTPGQVADFPAGDDLAGQLHWADKHANDLAMAEHNRRHFAAEAVRLRAAIAKTAA